MLHFSIACVFILVYVDDIIIIESDSGLISSIIIFLGSHFSIKNLGPVHFFLGIKLTQTSSGLFLSQSKYIVDLLQCTNMHLSKFVFISMSMYEPLSKKL